MIRHRVHVLLRVELLQAVKKFALRSCCVPFETQHGRVSVSAFDIDAVLITGRTKVKYQINCIIHLVAEFTNRDLNRWQFLMRINVEPVERQAAFEPVVVDSCALLFEYAKPR